MADVPATVKANLPVQKKAPEFPVDREKLAKESGRPADSGFRADLDNVKKLIRAVKAGYVRLTVDEGKQNPPPADVFRANEADITKAVSDVLGQSKLFDSQSLPLPLVNNENNKLWAYCQEFVKNPSKYGIAGQPLAGKLKPIGRDSQTAVPQK